MFWRANASFWLTLYHYQLGPNLPRSAETAPQHWLTTNPERTLGEFVEQSAIVRETVITLGYTNCCSSRRNRPQSFSVHCCPFPAATECSLRPQPPSAEGRLRGPRHALRAWGWKERETKWRVAVTAVGQQREVFPWQTWGAMSVWTSCALAMSCIAIFVFNKEWFQFEIWRRRKIIFYDTLLLFFCTLYKVIYYFTFDSPGVKCFDREEDLKEKYFNKDGLNTWITNSIFFLL